MKKRMMYISGAMLLSGIMAHASIATTVNDFYLSGAGSNTNTLAGASVGDYLVVLMAPNKKATAAGFTSDFGAGSTAGLQLVSTLQSDTGVNYTTWGWVYSVTGAGDIESIVSVDAANYSLGGRFLLHSDAGTLALGDTSVLTMDGGSGPEYWTNSFSWAAADDAVLMETIGGNAEGLTFTQTGIIRNNATTNQAIQYLEGMGSISSYENDIYTEASANWKDASTLGVVITETIPEPATLGMLGLVGGAILFIRRRFMN